MSEEEDTECKEVLFLLDCRGAVEKEDSDNDADEKETDEDDGVDDEDEEDTEATSIGGESDIADKLESRSAVGIGLDRACARSNASLVDLAPRVGMLA